MTLTSYLDVDALVDLLHTTMQAILGPRLVGLYLSGSLVTGDFDHDVSDIDLIAATLGELDERELSDLRAMHEEIARAAGPWNDRIDVVYVSVAALRNCRPGYRYPAVFRGEPFHLEEAGSDLPITWHVLREKGIAVAGPSPHTLLGPISRDDLVRAVQQACQGEWSEYIKHIRSRNSQAFWILLMCRALYTVREGDVVSKKAAALWAEKSLPEWVSVIRPALTWWLDAELWRNGEVDHDATLLETRRFVNLVLDEIVGEAHGRQAAS